MNKKLLEYNQKIYGAFRDELDDFQLGFFNGNDVLIIGQNPGRTFNKKTREDTDKVMEAKTFEEFQREYEDLIKKSRIGKFIGNIVSDWNNISFTNVVKVPTENNDVPSQQQIDQFLPITKEQIDLLQPRVIVCLGKFAGKCLGLTKFNEFKENYIMVYHPSYSMRKGTLKQDSEFVKKLISGEQKYDNIVHVQSVHRERPMNYIWTRNGDKKECHLVPVVHPSYFYVLDGEADKVNQLSGNLRKEFIGAQSGYKSLFGDSVTKLSWKNISKDEFRQAREMFDITFEADVKFNDRFIIDNKIEYHKNQRIMYLDIETNHGLNVELVDKEIISLVLYDSFKKKFGCFCWHKDETRRQEKKGDRIYYWFNTETDMLTMFVEVFRKLAPDIITGWYLDGYDIPYLLNRMRKLRVNYRRMSEINYCFTLGKQFSDFRISRIGGTSIIDLKRLYQKLTYDKKPDNYRLDTVAQLSLGAEKIKHVGFSDMWHNDREKLVEYNLRDVDLCVRIDEKTKLIDYALTIQELVGAPIDYALTNSKLIDYMILKKFHNKLVFPTADRSAAKEDFEGALTGKLVKRDGSWITINPDAKIHKNVAVFDFSKMYVSIYQTFNISPETIDVNGDIVIDDVKFTSSKEGIIPGMFAELTAKRKEIEKQRDSLKDVTSVEYYALQNKQGGVKALGNSIYGIMGFEKFRLYDTRVAKSVTSIGRKLLIELNKTCDKLGFDVLYSDTDSAFVKLKTGTVEEAKKIEDEINSDLKKWLKQQGRPTEHIEVDCEKIFKSLLFPGVKKKYAGMLKYKKGNECDEFFARGVELLKRDTPNVIRPLLKSVFIDILSQRDPLDIKRSIDNTKKSLKQTTPFELGFTKNISRWLKDYTTNVQHIRAARWSNKYLGTKFDKNDMPKILFVKSRIFDIDVIAIEDDTVLPNHIIIDYDKIVKHFIYSKILQLAHIQGLEYIHTICTNEKSLLEYMS